MGYSMQVVPRCLASSAHPSLLQWSITPAPANLSDIIISRLLEHYSVRPGAARPLILSAGDDSLTAANPTGQDVHLLPDLPLRTGQSARHVLPPPHDDHVLAARAGDGAAGVKQ
jgi:hypothetical protein